MRSPLLGYNHNVKYGGHIFHVQTEDSGPVNPHIFTHLFYEGSILASMRERYDPETPEDKVRALMQVQHKSILKQLKRSAYDGRIAGFFASRGEVFRPAEDREPGADVLAGLQPEGTGATASQEDVLDLDSLPSALTDPGRTPEPLPGQAMRPTAGGPGSYTLRRPSHDRVAAAPPPQPAARSRAATRAATRPSASRPAAPVVVQRQVVVGTSPVGTQRKPANAPVRRRPASGGPYVVKEGSHASAAKPPAASRSVPPPLPIAPVDELREAPRTASSAPAPVEPMSEPESAPVSGPEEAAPIAFVTEQSLDDVILAYLSQGESKK